MSYVMAAPDLMAAAATDVAAIGSTLSAAHISAAASTVAVIPAAADEVSASIAQLFSGFAHDFQTLAGQAAAFQAQFVQHLNASARSYAATEAAIAASLQQLTAIAGSPGQLLNGLTSLWNTITTDLIFIWNVLQIVGYLGYLLAYLAIILSFILLIFGILLVQFGLNALFGVSVSLPAIIPL